MAHLHFGIKSGKRGTAADHIAYITRKGAYEKRADLVCQRRLNSDPLWPVIADWNLTHPGPFKWCPAAGWFRPFSCP